VIPLQEFHPMLVHFPLVYLLSAVALDWVRAPRGDLSARTCISNIAHCLLLLGTAAAGVAAMFGDMAFDVARARGFPAAPIETHEEWATAALTFFVVFAVLRALAWWTRIPLTGRRAWLTALLGLVGIALLLTTAYHGGELVYRLGVNVAAGR